LVATLGSKSTARKVNRKAILDVDVPKACGTIIDPEAPMALRLQGNLLYGISRVYSQQCGYALTDALSIRDKMRTMLNAIRTSGLDPDAGKAKRDQIVLPDDPSFIPGLMLPGLNVDLSVLDFSTEHETPRRSSLLSSQLHQSSHYNNLSSDLVRLNLSSSSIGGGDAGGFGLASDMSSTGKKDLRTLDHPSAFAEEGGVLFQPDFEFDEEGNIIELPARQTPQEASLGIPRGSESGIASHVRRELEEAFQFQEQFQDQVPIHDDSEMRWAEGEHDILPSGEPFPERDPAMDQDDTLVIEETSEAPAAPLRAKPRSAKILGADYPQELRNSDLAQWNSEYVRNMALAKKIKQNNKFITQAKRNAEFWVVGMGIRAVGLGRDVLDAAHPLNMFAGDQLLGALTGQAINRRKRGRPAKDADDPGDEERRVRTKEDEDGDIGRGVEDDYLDDHVGAGTGYEDIEVGRHAPPSLNDDASSQMPWNITASIRGSVQRSSVHSRPFLPSVGGFSSVGGPQSVITNGPEGSIAAHSANGLALGRRTGRLTSASPLAGRSTMGPGFDQLGDLDGDLDMEDLDNLDLDAALDGHRHSSIEPNGATISGNKSYQPTAKLQQLASTLDQESVNFFEFVGTRIKDEQREEISFSSLLPPSSTTHAVATQGLLHLLTLATKGVLRVHQNDAGFGEIHISLAD
ncbi:hypothetical protein AJ80_09611, partial [Polytolypa hystricis UAMH7299]